MRWLVAVLMLGLVSCVQSPPTPPASTPKPPTSTANQCNPNGCGPARFIGKEFLNNVAGCPFLQACNSHDKCYARCAPACRSKQDATYCKQDVDTRRDACDQAFRAHLATLHSNEPICELAAEAYAQAVEAFGSNFILRRVLRAGDARLSAEEKRRIAADFERRFTALRNTSRPVR